MLPYTRWLDWCKIAVLVSEQTARTNMAAVLSRLEAIGKQEAAAMRRRLQDVRNAFVWRPPAADPERFNPARPQTRRNSISRDRNLPRGRSGVVAGYHRPA